MPYIHVSNDVIHRIINEFKTQLIGIITHIYEHSGNVKIIIWPIFQNENSIHLLLMAFNVVSFFIIIVDTHKFVSFSHPPNIIVVIIKKTVTSHFFCT